MRESLGDGATFAELEPLETSARLDTATQIRRKAWTHCLKVAFAYHRSARARLPAVEASLGR